jgi:hypothetical protein
MRVVWYGECVERSGVERLKASATSCCVPAPQDVVRPSSNKKLSKAAVGPACGAAFSRVSGLLCHASHVTLPVADGLDLHRRGCCAAQQNWLAMSELGHNPKLPHRNIAVRFSSNSRHYQERCSTPHAAVAPNLVLETRSGDSENPGARASLAPTFTRGAGMVYALLMPLPLGRRVAGHNPQPEASLQRRDITLYRNFNNIRVRGFILTGAPLTPGHATATRAYPILRSDTLCHEVPLGSDSMARTGRIRWISRAGGDNIAAARRCTFSHIGLAVCPESAHVPDRRL